MAFCKECGKAQGDEAKFCMECGTPVFYTTGSESGSAGSGQGAFFHRENLAQGQVVDGRYEIREKIGQGGFGTVYRVYDRKMEIEKALKVLYHSVINDGQVMEKLRKEATTMARLNHPNIVRVYDFQELGPVKYIDMEYVDGKTLKEVKLSFSRKKLSEEKALVLARQIARALAYAHGEKVIHRDIKPLNILVSRKSGVKIMDFGISETMQHSMSRVAHSEASGTLMYMSPEQIKGKDVGREADIYSFGALLYDLVSGKPPFHSGDITFQVLNENPEPVSAVSNKFNAFLMRCLAKDYMERYRSFDEVYAELKILRAAGTRPTPVVPVNPVVDKAGVEKVKSGPLVLPVPDLKALKPDVNSVSGWLRAQRGAVFMVLAVACLFILTVGLVNLKEPAAQADPVPPVFPPRLTNSLGMAFVHVEPGTFTMGSRPSEPGRFENEALQQVTLEKGYYMQTTEVTQGQWRKVMGNNPSHFSDCGDDCPVEKVSWDEVQAFLEKLNDMEKGGRFRLPSSVEWEYACRAGTHTAYAGGKRLEELGWYRDNAQGGTHAVAQKKANDWGLYDMHGNVWEWCSDKAGDDSNASDSRETEAKRSRILRGGSWLSGEAFCRAAVQSTGSTDSRLINLGFRVVFSM